MGRTVLGRRSEDRSLRTVTLAGLATLLPLLSVAICAAAGFSRGLALWVVAGTSFASSGVFGYVVFRLLRRIRDERVQSDDTHRLWRNEAHTDPLCNILNRRGAAETIEADRRAASDTAEWTVAMLDIDKFKSVNDSFGHAVGDRVLKSIADTITAGLPDGANVARWGGDEFVIFQLGESTDPVGRDMIGDIAKAISERSIPCRDRDLYVSVSYGVAHGSRDSRLTDLLSAADLGLMDMKTSRRTKMALTEAADLTQSARESSLQKR